MEYKNNYKIIKIKNRKHNIITSIQICLTTIFLIFKTQMSSQKINKPNCCAST